MAERVEVDVIVEAIAKGFAKVQADLKKTGTTADTAGKKAGKGFDAFDKSLKNIVTGGALGFIGAQLVQFGKDSIQAASDVEEMQSKFNTVFGELAGEVTGELQTFADAANRSIFDLQGFAASLQDTFVPMGFARDEAAKMSIQVVKLAEDLASFNNIPTEEALERLQGGLIGNHENLIKFGVRINEAVLKEQLLIDGTNELTGAALEQAKAQARMTLIMKGTTDAQGDAVKTADSFANKMKGLEAATSELKVAMGQGLLPVASEVVGVLTDMVNVMNDAASSAKDFQSRINSGELQKSAKFTQLYNDKLKELPPNMALAQKSAIAQQQAFGILQQEERRAAEMSAFYKDSVEEATPAVEDQTDAIFDMNKFMKDNLKTFADTRDALDAHEQKTQAAAAAEQQRVDKLKKLHTEIIATTAAQKQFDIASGKYFSTAIKAEQGTGLFSTALDSLGTQYTTIGGRTSEQSEDLGLLQEAYGKASRTIRDYEIGLKGANLTDEERAEKITEQKELMGGLQASMQPLLDITGELSERTVTAVFNQEAINTAFMASAESAGASATQLAILGLATGQLTEAQAEAALKSAALQLKIDELAQAYVNGTISIEDVKSSLSSFQEDLNEFNTAEVISEMGQVGDAAAAIAGDYDINFAIHTTGELPSSFTSGGGQSGFTEGVGLSQGADFVVPPGFNNDSYPIRVESGEHVTVTPKGQSRGGSGDTFNFYTSGQEAQATAMAQVQQRKSVNRKRRMGV